MPIFAARSLTSAGLLPTGSSDKKNRKKLLHPVRSALNLSFFRFPNFATHHTLHAADSQHHAVSIQTLPSKWVQRFDQLADRVLTQTLVSMQIRNLPLGDLWPQICIYANLWRNRLNYFCMCLYSPFESLTKLLERFRFLQPASKPLYLVVYRVVLFLLFFIIWLRFKSFFILFSTLDWFFPVWRFFPLRSEAARKSVAFELACARVQRNLAKKI